MSSLVRLEGICKSFGVGESEVEILHDIDLSVEQGEFVSIMGPSGSGKTTCLEIMGALSRPSAGRYLLDGEEIQTHDDDALADLRATRFGFVFQSFNLMPRASATRNVALPLLYAGVARTERERRARALLERVGLGHRLDHRPDQLSGGERQRVAVARALVNAPQLILADEPTGNLDHKTGMEILELFRTLQSEGHTLVVITHSEEVASYGEQVVRILDGRIKQAGPSA